MAPRTGLYSNRVEPKAYTKTYEAKVERAFAGVIAYALVYEQAGRFLYFE